MIIDPKSGVVSAALVRHQKHLIVLAWTVTMVPLLIFAYLTWQSIELRKDIAEARIELKGAEDALQKLKKERGVEEQRKIELITEKAKLEEQLKPLRDTANRYRAAAGIRIAFYRESDRKIVTEARRRLPFEIDAQLDPSPLISGETDTIIYGSELSEADRRDIAAAFIEAGLPLRRIAPATKRTERKLVQLIASVKGHQCGPLTVEQARAGTTCGAQ